MKLYTLDKIVRGHLFDHNLPIHYYVECMSHAVNCIRRMSKDSLQVMNTVYLTLNEAATADLPCDYVDFVSVGMPEGQWVRPIAQRDGISRLGNVSADGQEIPFSNVPVMNELGVTFGTWIGYSWYWNINDLGEAKGRLYGINSGKADTDGFKIIRERGVIQFTQSLQQCGMPPVMSYISDGLGCDSATSVDPMLIQTITAYIEWKRDQQQRNIEASPKGHHFYNQRKHYRANRNGLTLTDIHQILQESYTLTPKN